MRPAAVNPELRQGLRAHRCGMAEQLQLGKPISSGCWPIIVATTEDYATAVANTKIGANRSRFRTIG